MNLRHKVEGYCGICACCFEPIEDGEMVTLREGGRHFHKKCVEEHPNDYYIKLERRIIKMRANKKTAENGNSQTV